jgi:hypothetical protein
MPVEVPTREDIEKIVEEKLKKLLSEMQIAKKITELESSTAKLRDDIAKLSIKQTLPQPGPLTAALARELDTLVDLLQVQATSDSVTLKPKAHLPQQDFNAVKEIVRKHGGFWSPERRTFIIRKRE